MAEGAEGGERETLRVVPQGEREQPGEGERGRRGGVSSGNAAPRVCGRQAKEGRHGAGETKNNLNGNHERTVWNQI